MKGQKTGGRKKGTPNRKTLELKELAESLGVDPFEVLLLIAGGQYRKLKVKKWEITLSQRLSAAAECCSYLHPKRKAIEVTGKGGGPLDVYLRMTPEERAERREELESRLGKPEKKE